MILVLLFMALCFAAPLLVLAAFAIDELMRWNAEWSEESWGEDE